MVEKLNYIELSNGKYPMKCDLNVLELVQEEYGKLSLFERELSGLRPTGEKDEKGNSLYAREEPSVKVIRFALTLMVNEGIDIENAKRKKEREHITEQEAGVLASDVNIFDIAEKLHKEFLRCFESKNRSST